MEPITRGVSVALAVVTLAALVAAQPRLAERMQHRQGPAPAGSAHWPRSGQDDLAEQFRKRRPKPAELQAKLSELRASAGARRDAHRAELRSEFGDAALARKDFQAELGKHARRLAFLSRAKLVATTELDEPKRSATLTRIDQLLAKENTRHDGAVQKLKASSVPGALTPAAPAGSVP
ncbi:MAG TPA: hypothetical protein VMI54_16375 [Polyangiaceae bacterium]|nr:hypothetical protein [Polyangiaceae bacterium]